MDSEAKALTSLEQIWEPLVTSSDESTTATPRSVNNILAARVRLVMGPANMWARMNAQACAAQRVCLYRRTKASRRPVKRSNRKRLESGRAGAKVAEWASTKEDIEEVTDAPVLDLLNRPNGYMTGAQFAFNRFWCAEAAGNAFVAWVMGAGSSQPVALWPLQPQHVTPILSESVFLEGWWYGREGIAVRRFEVDEILHYKYWMTDNPYLGAAWCDDVAEAITVLKANYEHQHRFIQGGYHPPYVFELADGAAKVDPEQLRMTKLSLQRDHAGLKKWDNPIFLQHWKLVPITSKPREYQTLEQLDAFRRDIRNAAGVPESMADVNDANLASARVGYDKQYLGATIEPRVQAVAQMDTEMLLPLFGMEPGEYFFAADDIVPADNEAKLRWQTSAIDKWATRNEVRREDDMDPVDGGDEFATATPAMPEIDAGAAPDDEAAAQATQDVQVAEAFVLNGAQITAAVDIVSQVTAGTLPRDAGIGMLTTLFNLKPEQAEGIMGSAGTKAPTTPNPNPAAEAAQEAANAIAGNVSGAPNGAGAGKGDRGAGGVAGDGAEAGRPDRGGAGDAERDEASKGVGGGVPATKDGPASGGGAGGGTGDGLGAVGMDAGLGGAGMAGDGGHTPGKHHAHLRLMVAHYEPCCHAEGVRVKAAPDDAFQAALKGWYTTALSEAAVNAVGASIRDIDVDALARILDDFLPQYASIGADQAARAVQTGEAFDVVPSLPDDYTARLARELSGSAQEALTRTIVTGIEEGQSIAQIQVAIEEAVPDIAGYSAERVARTESATAVGLGKTQQWDSMGVTRKEWQLAVAGCPLCEAFYATKSAPIPMTQPFARAGEAIAYTDESGQGKTYSVWRDVQAAPLHPNCRCDVLPVLEDEE